MKRILCVLLVLAFAVSASAYTAFWCSIPNKYLNANSQYAKGKYQITNDQSMEGDWQCKIEVSIWNLNTGVYGAQYSKTLHVDPVPVGNYTTYLSKSFNVDLNSLSNGTDVIKMYVKVSCWLSTDPSTIAWTYWQDTWSPDN